MNKDGMERVHIPCPDGIKGCAVMHYKWIPIEKELTVDDIELWRTKLEVIELPVSTMDQLHDINASWVVTDFVKRFGSDKYEFIVQPLINEGTIQQGVTGLLAYVVTEEQLIRCFRLKKEK